MSDLEMETEDIQNLGKRNHEEDSEEIHSGVIKRNRGEDCKVVHYDPKDYSLIPKYEEEKNSSSSEGYPYFFLWKGNLVEAYDENITCPPDGVKVDKKRYYFMPGGDPLMEVFNMRIERKCQGSCELSSGNIKIEFGGDVVEIYCQGKTQEKYISDGALLLPVDAAIDALSTISIYVDLNIKSNFEHKISEHRITDRCYKHYFHPETELWTRKRFEWDYYCDGELANKALSYTVDDENKYFSATIYFSLFYAATHATVEVSLINEPDIYVYGLISARNDLITDINHESILFLRENSSQSEPVLCGQPIKLYKSMVAVPLGCSLIVRAFLRTDGYHFPSAKLLFPVQEYGESELSIRNKVRVKVTWKHYWMRSPMDY